MGGIPGMNWALERTRLGRWDRRAYRCGTRDRGRRGRRQSEGARRTWRGGATVARARRQADDELGTRAWAIAADRDASPVRLDQGLHKSEPESKPARVVVPGLGALPEEIEHLR